MMKTTTEKKMLEKTHTERNDADRWMHSSFAHSRDAHTCMNIQVEMSGELRCDGEMSRRRVTKEFYNK